MFYVNVYLKDEKIVVETPLIQRKDEDKQDEEDIRAEKLDIGKYSYFLPCY